MDVSNFDTSYAINIRGVWLGIKYAVTQMLSQPPLPTTSFDGSEVEGDRGWIINLSSIYGLVASPRLSAYCTAKGAVTNMTRQAALEYADQRIHVNSIHPGYCDSPFLETSRARFGREAMEEMWTAKHPWGRLAWPEDVAKMAVFLAGDGVAFVTGQRKCFLFFLFVLRGGFLCRPGVGRRSEESDEGRGRRRESMQGVQLKLPNVLTRVCLQNSLLMGAIRRSRNTAASERMWRFSVGSVPPVEGIYLTGELLTAPVTSPAGG